MFKIIMVVLTLFSHYVIAAPKVVSELDHTYCEELDLKRELKIYKDPSVFLPQIAEVYTDPSSGWKRLFEENPVLTNLKGTVHIMRLGEEREFKNMGVIAKLYEGTDKRFDVAKRESKTPVRVLPIKICSDSYRDTLGFVLVTDMNEALKDVKESVNQQGMPPSVYPNPVPTLKKSLDVY